MKLVHSSDLHIADEPGIDGYTGLIGLAAVLATARALCADIVLLAGDSFDNHRVSTPVLRQTAAILATAGRPIVLLPGNHDPAMPECLFSRAGIIGLPDIHVLGISNPGSVRFDRYGLEVWGHAHRSYADMSPLHRPQKRSTQWQVAMAHGHYVPAEDRERDAHRAWKITDEELTAAGADYVALGHWDRPTKVGPGSVRAYYSGSPDLARSVNVVCFNEGGSVSVDVSPLI
jgi:DNA repair exonuclease SbcCD nuclease subunit